MKITFQKNSITVQNDQQRILARLTYFRLPSQKWLIEQVFAISPQALKRTLRPLIKAFFTKIPHQSHCVRILDPFVRSDLRDRSIYQEYLYKNSGEQASE